MLPTRLFRNTGIPPPFRSLITPHPSLPASLRVQLRLRLGANGRRLASSSGSAPKLPANDQIHPLSAPAHTDAEPSTSTTKLELARQEPKLSITFTCTAPDCGPPGVRSTHEFSRRAYERGIVLVQCPGCKNRHLIADHLGWFKDSTGDGKLRTIEDLMRARGETVRRGRGTGEEGGVVEFYDE
ncbi:DNL zinc finger-domain-containing protein [Infundibulicybe gibba]|nr:DNL zinc finger-domain-containing protein [Infundibulicybe gibba]